MVTKLNDSNCGIAIVFLFKKPVINNVTASIKATTRVTIVANS